MQLFVPDNINSDQLWTKTRIGMYFGRIETSECYKSWKEYKGSKYVNHLMNWGTSPDY